jgi:hypothetical protein
MSNARAIAAVTRTLQRHLSERLSDVVAGARVTTKPPDRARPDAAAGPQLNLFLYQTSIDAAWRNRPPLGGNSFEDTQPALPLVLSYLLTAYGEEDDDIESQELLGAAMSALSDRPLLSRSDISVAFPGAELENQVERIRITPHPLPLEDISRLWTTFQTGYRISVSYDVAVVLIDSSLPSRSAVPVLARGTDDVGPRATTAFPPDIDHVVPPGGAPAAAPGDVVRLIGRHLGGVTTVTVTGDRLTESRSLPVSSSGPGEVTVDIPDDDDLLPAGTVLLTPLAPASEAPGKTVMLRLAPTLDMADGPLEIDLVDGTAEVTVTCKPPIHPGQRIQLIVGDRLVKGKTPAEITPECTFELKDFEAGRYLLRVRVDDQDSIPIDVDNPLGFDDKHHLVLQ